jgi:hypothetical protein
MPLPAEADQPSEERVVPAFCDEAYEFGRYLQQRAGRCSREQQQLKDPEASASRARLVASSNGGRSSGRATRARSRNCLWKPGQAFFAANSRTAAVTAWSSAHLCHRKLRNRVIWLEAGRQRPARLKVAFARCQVKQLLQFMADIRSSHSTEASQDGGLHAAAPFEDAVRA